MDIRHGRKTILLGDFLPFLDGAGRKHSTVERFNIRQLPLANRAALAFCAAHDLGIGRGFQPFSGLLGRGRIRIGRVALRRHRDVLFKKERAFAEGDADAVQIGRLFVGGKAYWHAWVTLLQVADLIQFEMLPQAGVFSDAMHDGKFLLPMAEKGNDLIDFFGGGGGGGSDDGQVGFAHPFQKGPVGKGTTGYLDDVEVQFFHQIDARFIPRSTHRDETRVLNRAFQALKVFRGQFGFGEAFDVFVIGPLDVIRMEVGFIPMLQFHAELELREVPRDFFKFTDDAKAMLNITHVIVGHFKNKQRSGDGFDHAVRSRESLILDRRSRSHALRALISFTHCHEPTLCDCQFYHNQNSPTGLRSRRGRERKENKSPLSTFSSRN